MDKVRAQYEKFFGKKVPNNKKNDKDWIMKKVDDFLEGGTVLDVEVPVKTEPIKAPKKKKEDIPEDVLALAKTLENEKIGKYYSGRWIFEVTRQGMVITKKP